MGQNKSKLSAIAAIFAFAVAPGAQAEEGIYVGAGLAFGIADSNDNFPLTGFRSANESVSGGVTLGYRIERGNMFFGPELDAEFFFNGDFDFSGTVCSTIASGPYLCERDAVYRLRAIVGGRAGGGYEWFGSFGYGVVTGKGANTPATQDDATVGGWTLGAGVQHRVGARGKVRLEVIHDVFSTGIENPTAGGLVFSPDYTASSLKATYLFSF